MNEHVTVRRGQRYLDAIRLQFGAAIEEATWQTDDQVTVTVALHSLPEVVETLYYGHDGWLATIVANDERQLNGHYALYYILSMEGEDRCFFVVRALVPAHRPEFPSVTPRVPAMVWGEREVRDMFGLQPVGLPDQRRLVLPDDWPDDLYPLRKGTMDYRTRPMRRRRRRPTHSSTRRPRPRPKSRSGRSTSPRTSPPISGCSSTESGSSTPTIGSSTSTAGWRSSPRPG